MGTITKALDLLNYFSESAGEIGLADFTKRSGRDKATVHRYLIELMNSGFLEQDQITRQYRLGPAILRLAAVRERTFPARNAVASSVDALSNETGELVHVSLLQSNGLSTLYHKDAMLHGTRVHFNEAAILPLHATSSGIAMLAFGSDELLKQLTSKTLKKYTDKTLTKPAELLAAVDQARSNGVAFSDQGFEDDVYSVAVPIYDKHQCATGTVAIAVPLSRKRKLFDNSFISDLKSTGALITEKLGGIVPEATKKIWESDAYGPAID